MGFPTWYKYLGGKEIADKCSVVLTFPDDIGKILLAIVEILLRVGGLAAVAFVIYGGFQFILSQGDPEKAASARKTISITVGLSSIDGKKVHSSQSMRSIMSSPSFMNS